MYRGPNSGPARRSEWRTARVGTARTRIGERSVQEEGRCREQQARTGCRARAALCWWWMCIHHHSCATVQLLCMCAGSQAHRRSLIKRWPALRCKTPLKWTPGSRCACVLGARVYAFHAPPPYSPATFGIAGSRGAPLAGGAATACARALAWRRLVRHSARRTRRCSASSPRAWVTAVLHQFCLPRRARLRLRSHGRLSHAPSHHALPPGPVMGEEGLCLSNQKCMCLSQAIQCIPTKPFIEVASICKQRCRVFGAHTHAYTFHARSMPDRALRVSCSLARRLHRAPAHASDDAWSWWRDRSVASVCTAPRRWVEPCRACPT